MAELTPGLLAYLFPGGSGDYSGQSIRVALHTGDAEPTPVAAPARLFLLTAAGDRIACSYHGDGWFVLPPGRTILARSWEIRSEGLGTIASGTFAAPPAVDAEE